MIRFLFRKQAGPLDFYSEASFGRERIVVTGENGSGKTTLLRLIAGLDRPDHGHLHFFEQPWMDSDSRCWMPSHERRVGCVFSDPNLLPWLSVAENICISVPKDRMQDVQDAVRELARTLRLREILDRKCRHLSAGEAQRVSLARALMAEPTMLLLDEPFSAQSPKMRAYLREWLVALHEQLRFPMVLVSHDPNDSDFIGEQHWYMRNGKLILPKEVATGRCEANE